MPLAAISNKNSSDNNCKTLFGRAPIVSFDSVNDVSKNSEYHEEEMYIGIIKGANGFGFTIAEDLDSNYQKIKQIVNKERCVDLMENDVLVEINNVDLNGMNHNQVVEILKNCVCEQETIFKLKRKIHKQMKNCSHSTTMQKINDNSKSLTSFNSEYETISNKGKMILKAFF